MDLADLTLTQEPYGTPARLQARIAVHAFGRHDAEDFHAWVWRRAGLPASLPEDAAVLEVGVGTARMWATMAGRIPAGWRLTLSDRSPGMMAAARAALDALGRQATCLVADADALPFDDGAFDLVFANHMLYHVPDLPRAVAELRRVLRPGGRLVAATNGDAHLQELAEALRDLRAAGPDVRVDLPHRLSFTLENGAATLRAAFDDVERHDREDELLLDDAELIVRYLLSMTYAPDTATARALTGRARALVAARLVAGPMRVRRVSGVFVAS
ncbi:MAG: class I SAM-dependent methyltransferase [Trueperaceae bacterium]|nr:class I SAM-dependent methyltransferase [Trueperaceae bacterium]